jgi:hypothetical protein
MVNEPQTVTLYMFCGTCRDTTEHRYTLAERQPGQRRAYTGCACQDCGTNGYEVGQL